jgi:hypothetical protein
MSGKMECGECGAGAGRHHVLGCPKERCPFCRGQLAFCSCQQTQVGLSDERASQARPVGYRDEENRLAMLWKEVLEKKGRIPWDPILPEKILRLGMTRVPGYEYFLRDGAVWRVPHRRAGQPAPSQEQWIPVAEALFERDAGFLYTLDADGDVARIPRKQ